MKKALAVLLTILNFFLVFWIIRSVKSEVDQQTFIREREKQIVEKLKFIRRLQITHKTQKGRYAKNWEDLVKFGEEDSIFVIDKKENPALDPAGFISSIAYEADTILRTSVYDSLVAKFQYSIATVNEIPGYKERHFVLSTEVIVMGGVNVEVIEVSCPPLINRDIKFGSLESPTLAGNWK